MKRLNTVLALLLGAQVLAAVGIWATRGHPDAAAAATLLPDFDAAQVDGIEIFEGAVEGAPADEKPRQIALARRAGAWVVSDHDDYPARQEKVDEILGKLAALHSRGPVTDSEERHRQLGVADDEFERKLVLRRGGEETTLLLGAGSSFRQTHVRLAGAAETHAATGFSVWDLSTAVSAWIDTTYFEVPEAEVVGIEVENASGRLSLRRHADEAWRLEDGTGLDQAKVDPILRAAARIPLSEPAGRQEKPEHGLGTGAIRVVLSVGDPFPVAAEQPAGAGAEPAPVPPEGQRRELTLTIGSVDASARYYVKAPEREHVALVDKFSVQPLVELTRAKLLGS